MNQMNKNDDFFERENEVGDDEIIEYDVTTSPRDLTPASIVDMIDSGIFLAYQKY